MDPIIVKRINELARKARSPEGLTDAEKAERAELRRRYCDLVKGDLEAQLANVVIVDENGVRRPVRRKDEKDR